MECFKYAFNILTVSDGIYSINPGGLQADLMGGGSGGGGAGAEPPPVNKYIYIGSFPAIIYNSSENIRNKKNISYQNGFIPPWSIHFHFWHDVLSWRIRLAMQRHFPILCGIKVPSIN